VIALELGFQASVIPRARSGKLHGDCNSGGIEDYTVKEYQVLITGFELSDLHQNIPRLHINSHPLNSTPAATMSTLEDLDDMERDEKDQKKDKDGDKKPTANGDSKDAEMKDAEPEKKEEDDYIDMEILHSSTRDIINRRRLLENEMKILKSEFQRLTHEQNAMKEKIKENLDKIENNRLV
jgi:hypothetical protein